MILFPVFFIQEVIVSPLLPQKISATDTRLIWYFLLIIIMSFFTMLYDICIIKITYNHFESKSESISDTMAFALRLWPKAIATSVIYAFSIFFGFMLFVLPGIILLFAYYLYLYILVRTGLWGRKALLLSHFYTKADIKKIVSVSVAFLLLSHILSQGIYKLQSLIPVKSFSLFAAFLLFWFMQTAFSLVTVYFASYVFNTKINFDITKLQNKKSDDNAAKY